MSTITSSISGLTAGGDIKIIVSESIQNSFNRIHGWQGDPKLKGDMQQLIQQVAEVTGKLKQDNKADQAKDMEQKLDALTDAVVSKKRPFYSVTAEGLKEAAKAVGDIAAPVIATVSKILPLLAMAP